MRSKTKLKGGFETSTGKPTPLGRAYVRAVEFLAYNIGYPASIEDAASQISVIAVAEAFLVSPQLVAMDIIRLVNYNVLEGESNENL